MKYKIGDKIIDEKRNITITGSKIKYRDKKTDGKIYQMKQEYYLYHCNNCGYDGEIEKHHFDKEGKGCIVCAGRKVVYGINDLYTQRPDLLVYIVDKEKAKTYTPSSHNYEDCKCPECGYVKNMRISNLNFKGFKCDRCNDNISYPNKFLASFLNQLMDNNLILNYELEKTFKWSNNKRYDAFIVLNNGQTLIIEAHGNQHFGYKNIHNKTFKNGTKTLQEEQRNDADKCWLAYKNGIDNYVQLDCRESNLDFIKTSIENSIIGSLLTLSKVNWEECNSFATSSFLLKVCNYWEENKKQNPNLSTKDVGEYFKMNRFTIIKYLKQGGKLGFCTYNPKQEMEYSRTRKDKDIKTRKRIGIYKDGVLLGEYECMARLQEEYLDKYNIKLDLSNIQAVARGKRKTHKGFTFKYL